MRKAFRDLRRTRRHIVQEQCVNKLVRGAEIPQQQPEQLGPENNDVERRGGVGDISDEEQQHHSDSDVDNGSGHSDRDVNVPPDGSDSDNSEDTLGSEDENAGSVQGSGDDSSDCNSGESDVENDEEFNFQGRGANQPLYTGAPITIMESMCLILAIMLKHNLTAACVADILQLINLHCPPLNLFRHSLYLFKKFYSVTNAPFKKTYFCSVCFRKLPVGLATCNTCPGDAPSSYFVHLPLTSQLKVMLKRPNFFNLLRSRLTRNKCEEGCMEDVYDGKLYKEHAESGFLSEPNQISFLWNSDGFPIFKSKRFSGWPFFLAINELPFKGRFSRQNVLLAGFWYGSLQPNVNLFVKSFKKDLTKLCRGVKMFAHDLQQKILIKAFVLLGTCDLPAKSKFFSVMQFNGDYGCPCCETRESFELGPRSTTHIYKYTAQYYKRTLQNMSTRAEQASEIGDPVNGVKGPTILKSIMPDFVRGMSIDLMHLAMGIIKKYMDLLFGESYGTEPFSLRAFIPVVNDRVLSIKPPKFVHRMPREVEEFCHWKASEIKLWLFYYSPVVLNGIMRPDYYGHYMKLVIALSYLSASHVSAAKILKAEELLHSFVKDFETMYGERHCSISIHLLLHLPDCVRELGPLWAYTCFPFENLIGLTLKCIHGTRFVDSQVCNSFWKTLTSARKFWSMPEGAFRDFCLNPRNQSRILERIAAGCYAVGTYYEDQEDAGLIRDALAFSRLPNGRIQKFFRLLKDGLLYISDRYQRDIQTKSSFCLYERAGNEFYGNILLFIKVWENCLCNVDLGCECAVKYYAIIQEVVSQNVFTVFSIDAELDHLHKCRIGNRVIAIPVQDLCSVCFYMYIDEQSYVAEPVNSMELE